MRTPQGVTGWEAPTQTATTTTRGLIETHVRVAPGSDTNGFASQAAAMYENLDKELRRLGASREQIVTEKVFLSDLPAQASELAGIRASFHARTGDAGGVMPASTLLEQPPAWDGRLCELQAVVMQPSDGFALPRRTLRGLPEGATGLLVSEGNLRHIFVSGVTTPGMGKPSGFQHEASTMFELAEECLRREEMSFHDVVRTWIYLADVDADYGYLNLARRDFFTKRGIEPPPASTGIRGVPYPAGRACGLDLRAIAAGGSASLKIGPIGAPTMNEAPEYGSDFSRGTRIDLPDRVVIHLSGTASIDTDGCVVHPGSISGQVDRMLLNLEELLDGQGAGYDSLVSATTYLKDARDLDLFRDVALKHRLPETIPNTIVVADICRTGWLCEIEAVAVLV